MTDDFRDQFLGYQLSTWADALAAMQPIERETVVEALEIRELESWFNDELKCEAVGEHACTAIVTARAYWCRAPQFVCGRAEANIREELDRGKVTCAGCKSPVAACWRVVSI